MPVPACSFGLGHESLSLGGVKPASRGEGARGSNGRGHWEAGLDGTRGYRRCGLLEEGEGVEEGRREAAGSGKVYSGCSMAQLLGGLLDDKASQGQWPHPLVWGYPAQFRRF